MKRILVLFAGLILSVPTAQAKESSIYSIFSGEIGKSGVLKQLAAISKAAAQDKKSQSEGQSAGCPSSVKLGQSTKQLVLRHLPTEVRCRFAFDLHRFVASKGRDYDTVLNSGSNSTHGTKKAMPVYLPYLSYLEQEGFANGWWTKENKKYRESGAEEKKRFLHEAIVDATSLYGMYGQRVYGTAAYVVWEEAALRAVLKKQ